MIKRVLIILAPLILAVTALYGTLVLLKPKIDQFANNQIRSFTSSNLPIEMTVEHVNVHFLPPAIELNDIKIIPKEVSKFGFEFVEVDTILGELDILELLVGKIAIQTLTIEDPMLDIDLDHVLSAANKNPSTSGSAISTKQALNLKPLFDELKIIPIQRFLISDLSSRITSKQLNLDLSIDNTQVLVINGNKSLSIRVETDLDQVAYKKIKDSAYLSSSIIIRPNSASISKFHFSSEDIDLNLNAEILDFAKILIDPQFRGSAELKINLEKTAEKIKSVLHLPKITGETKLNTKFEYKNHNFNNTTFSIKGDNLSVDDFILGKLETTGELNQQTLSCKNIQITNEATLLDINNFSITRGLGENALTLKAQLDTEMLDLNELLKIVTVGEIPLELFIQGKLNCGGPIYPQFNLRCDGALSADHLDVRGANHAKNSIVEIPIFETQGFVTIDTEKVQYKADIGIGDNKGFSEGVISYKEGFDISYSTNKLDFRNIKNLAGLKLEGSAKLKGKTKGDSKSATFWINSETDSTWLENFYLGKAKFLLSYAKGQLSLSNIEGIINQSTYKANVDVDLIKDRIRIDGNTSSIEANDALAIFKRKVQLPFSITGVGTASAQVEGPFDFSHMSYDFKSTLVKPVVFGETIDTVDFHVKSKDGEVQIQNLKIRKGHGEITGTGVAHPNAAAEIKFVGKNMFVEESDNVARLGTNMLGRLNFNLDLNGHILHPKGFFNGSLTELAIEDMDVPPSTATFQFDEHGIKGTANLVGGKLKSEYLLPISDQDPFKFEASARDWNFTTLFTLVGGAPLLPEYLASLTGDINLHSEKGGIFQSSGEGTILKAHLKRGDLELTNPGPMDIIVDHGKLILKNFKVSGGNSYVELATNGSTPKDLNFKLNGKVETHLFQVFLPFLDQLSGLASVKVSIGGTLEKPEVFGNAEYEKGTVKLHDFPHPFEKINASAQFSQTKVVVSNVTATLGGGTLTGDGNILINGIKDLPMQFQAHAENINLNIPDQVKTSGTADLVFSGNWFPFTLAGLYRINGGMITKEFGSDAGLSGTQQSSYLPKILLQSAFDPIRLNLQTVMEQPLTIKNSLVDGQVTGALSITGSPTQPILNGKVALNRNSKVNFRDKAFDVTTADLTFNDPKEINPEIYLLAQSRVTTYDVSLNVQGKSKNPVIRLSSQPPLAEHDIVSLLALGMTTASLEEKGAFQQKDQQQNLQTQVIAAGFQQLIGKEVQKAFDVDIQISSQYDDARNLSTQKYTINGKFTDKLTYSGSRTMGDQSLYDIKLSYAINPQVSVSTSLERVESTQTTGTTTQTQSVDQILGLDLEFKQEFK